MLGTLIAMFASALAAPVLARLGAKGGLALAIVPAGGAAFLGIQALQGKAPHTEAIRWVPSLGIDLSFYIDGLGLLFGLLITVLGTLVIIYASGYFERPKSIGRFYGLLFVFMGGMLGLVSAGNLLVVYLFWEVTTISSFLLIGFHSELEHDRENARQALLVTASGGLALLGGIILLGQAAGTYALPDLLARGEQVRSSPLYPAIVLLVFAGCFTKSAQVPFHFWLPNAMVAPTPVSAYLHSATMVKAGIFLLWRLQPVLGGEPLWHYTLELFGAVTMLTGAVIAVVQTDLKRILAYSTISVLGMIVLLTGIGTEAALEAATAYLLVHALYKGALFLVAGALDRATGTRDVTRLGRLGKRMPLTAVAGVLSALSMAGLPPLLGFIGKELLYEAQVGAPRAAWLITMFGVAANVLLVTVAILVGVHPFFGRCPSVYEKAHEVKREMLFGPVLLAFLGLMFGLFPDAMGAPLLSRAISAVKAQQTEVRLALWHGFNPVFLLSVITVVTGGALYFARRYLRDIAAHMRLAIAFTPSAWFRASLRLLHGTAAVHTRILQHGFLAGYVGVVLAATAAALLYAVFPFPAQGVRTRPAFLDAVLLATLVVNCWLLLKTSARMAAIVGLSALGVIVALFYGINSGLDLAMVQFSVETLGIVLLLLVLLKLPERYRYPVGRLRTTGTGAVALLAGGAIAVAMYAAGTQGVGSMGAYYIENSVSEGHGRNIVNVILVDFRALDTLGEITVVGIAALSVLAMLRKEHLS